MQSKVKSLCGFEVNQKIKQLEIEGGARAPVYHSARRQCVELKNKTRIHDLGLRAQI